VGAGFHLDDDAVLHEGDAGVVGVNRAGGPRRAFEVEAPVGAGKELLLQGALEGIAANAELDGAGGRSSGGQQQKAAGG